MKIAYCSDLHLEVGKDAIDFDLPDADILLLAGDICSPFDLRDAYEFAYISGRQRNFLRDISKKYKNVYWVMGNHEYWDNSLTGAFKDINDFMVENNITNIEVTSRDTFSLNGVLLIIATLWTDVDKGNYVQTLCGDYMRDYEKITVKNPINPELLGRHLRIEDTIEFHKQHRQFIKNCLPLSHVPKIVMTHHCPVLTPNKPKTERDTLKWFYYCTDMEDIILDNPSIKYWIHGHDHSVSEYDIGQTKLLSNCRGYKGYEEMAETFKIKVFEI